MKRLVLALVSVLLCTAPALAAGSPCGIGQIQGPSYYEYRLQPCIVVPNQAIPGCVNCPGMAMFLRGNTPYCVQYVLRGSYTVVPVKGDKNCGPTAVLPWKAQQHPAQFAEQAQPAPPHTAPPAPPHLVAPAPAPRIAPPMPAPPHVAPPAPTAPIH